MFPYPQPSPYENELNNTGGYSRADVSNDQAGNFDIQFRTMPETKELASYLIQSRWDDIPQDVRH